MDLDALIDARYRSFLECLPDATIVSDGSGRILLANRQAEALFEYGAGELAGQPLDVLIPERFRSGHVAQRASFFSRPRVRPMHSGLQLYGRRRSGEEFPVEISLNHLEVEGARLAISAIRDLTGPLLQRVQELERANARLAQEMEEKTRAEGTLRYVTEKALCLLWHAEIEETEGPYPQWRSWLAHPDAAQAFFPLDLRPDEEYLDAWLRARSKEDLLAQVDSINAAVRAGRGYSNEFRARDREGRDRWLREEVQIETVSPGRWRAVGLVIDLTEQKRLEEQYRQSQKMEAVGRLAGGVAHDFNNLLAVINGYADLLQMKLDADHPMLGPLREIAKAGEKAARLTRQLLAFSRRQVLQPKLIDLTETVGDFERMLGRLIGEDVEVALVRSADPCRVLADPGQVEQIILNLAVNARDAMPEGGRLTIETSLVELDEGYSRQHFSVPPGRYVLLAVSDTGCGMDTATRARIFEPFFTTKEAGEGTGLGLAMVYGIVKQSGGDIWVYSEPGKGTTFKIYLPEAAEAPAEARPSEPPPVARGVETVLLVEDEPAVRRLVRISLEERGYTVLEAEDPDDALRMVDENPGEIHLLLTDVVMPGLGGRQVAEQITAVRPHTRVLYMSGYTSDTVVRRGVLTSSAAFLQKPFSPTDLLRKVREVLDAP
jgi:two-component system, cell cycle sensor histidine kinase and response regulator CckA